MKLRHFLCCAAACLAGLAPAARAETEYFAVFMEGKKIGHGTHNRKVDAGKVTTTETLEMTMSRMGMPITLRQAETVVETTAGKPLSFTSVQDMAVMAVKVQGTVDARGKVRITITSGTSTQERTMDWPEGAVMSEGLRLLQMKKGLKQGTTYAAKVFAGSMMSAMDAEIRIGPTRSVDLLGRVLKLTEVTASFGSPAGQIVTTSYVSKDLKALKTVVPVAGMNIEVVACNRKLALSKPEVFEAFSKLTVASPVPLGDPAEARSITYHLAPVGKKTLSIPATDNQTVRTGPDGTVTVTVRRNPAPAGGRFPYKGTDAAALAATKPTRFLQSKHPTVVALARRAVGDVKDAAEAARRIESFVRKHIHKKGLSIGYATAAEVAENRQGDCSEHAVLVAAMCRAVGIPSRVASGIAYVGTLGQAENVFGGHAWAQALVADKWVDLDAAMNGFDPGHIALAVGDGSPEDFFQILTNLGYFKITKVVVGK